MSDSDDDAHTFPAQNPRIFGSGLKRKLVTFVPASTSSSADPKTESKRSLSAQLYSSIVFPKTEEGQGTDYLATPSAPPTSTTTASATAAHRSNIPQTAITICDICKTAIDPNSATPHEATFVHQLSIPHTHPPSSIDRTRKGLAYLEAHGWDVDSRKGLGATGEGMLHPIKAKEKKDRGGIGAPVPKTQDGVAKKPKKLNAKGARKMEEHNKRKRQALHQMIFHNDDVERYLG